MFMDDSERACAYTIECVPFIQSSKITYGTKQYSAIHMWISTTSGINNS